MLRLPTSFLAFGTRAGSRGTRSKKRVKSGTRTPADDRIESPTFFTFGKAFKTLWDQTDWLRKHSCTIVRYTLRYQADAWKAFFEGRDGYPEWKHRNSDPSVTIPENIRIRDRKLAVPKVGWLSIRRRGGNRYPAGRPVKAVIRRIGRRWEAVVCYEVPAPQQNDNGRIIGIDRNAGQVADSDGEIHRMPDLKRLETRLKRHQRSLSRKCKGSRWREKQSIRVQRAGRRLRNARRNWQHQGSRRITAKARTAVIEKLSTGGMTNSARGTTDRPTDPARRCARRPA